MDVRRILVLAQTISGHDAGVPLESHSIRFPADVWAAIENSARHQGISASAFVRIGALSYAAYSIARRGDEVPEGFDKLWTAARDLLAVYDLDEDG